LVRVGVGFGVRVGIGLGLGLGLRLGLGLGLGLKLGLWLGLGLGLGLGSLQGMRIGTYDVAVCCHWSLSLFLLSGSGRSVRDGCANLFL